MVGMQTHNLLITFKGGPLDGQTKIKTLPGRWPAYLAEDGVTSVPAAEGDRWTRTGKRGVYRNTERADLSTFPATVHHVYVHSSIQRGTS